MFENERAQLSKTKGVVIAKDPNRTLANKILLAPYVCKMYFGRQWGVFGRSAFDYMAGVNGFHNEEIGPDQPSVTVGDFSEAATGCAVLLGGEHRNDMVVNAGLGLFPDIRYFLRQDEKWKGALFSRGAVTIGSNVTLGFGATVLSGVTIGHGAVIGANALVNKDVPPFAIVAGQPAKVIRYRFEDDVIENLLKLRWWDFSLAAFKENYYDIQNAEDPASMERLLSLGAGVYKKPERDKNKLVFNILREGSYGANYQFIGAEVEGQFIPAPQLPDMFKFFISQINNVYDEGLYLIKDIFYLSGLTKVKTEVAV